MFQDYGLRVFTVIDYQTTVAWQVHLSLVIYLSYRSKLRHNEILTYLVEELRLQFSSRIHQDSTHFTIRNSFQVTIK